MGTITHIVDEGRAAYVRFKNDAIGLYSTDALLMLIPPELVVDKLRADIENIRYAGFRSRRYFRIVSASFNRKTGTPAGGA
ncbi:hypothetical protein [Sphingobacterium daejeonense]|uniref:hypothetical protein n=1 Tax=Sphingobacterium daejeonense TaxID=371142 RepID=UPI0010FD9330|nr:hypothetical protein [Sphingobacterium daejeonense]